MKKAIIEISSGKKVNVISLPDTWTGAEDEWQVPSGYSLADVVVFSGTVAEDSDGAKKELSRIINKSFKASIKRKASALEAEGKVIDALLLLKSKGM